jgi:predicted GTPase
MAIDKSLIDDIQIEKIKNQLEILNYSDEHNQCYYISLAKSLKSENIIEHIKNKIYQIEKLIK